MHNTLRLTLKSNDSSEHLQPRFSPNSIARSMQMKTQIARHAAHNTVFTHGPTAQLGSLATGVEFLIVQTLSLRSGAVP